MDNVFNTLLEAGTQLLPATTELQPLDFEQLGGEILSVEKSSSC